MIFVLALSNEAQSIRKSNGRDWRNEFPCIQVEKLSLWAKKGFSYLRKRTFLLWGHEAVSTETPGALMREK